jgi:hypothetical protein
LIPNYKNANQKAEEAFQYAVHRVVIEPVYDVYRLHDRDYFDLQKAFDYELFHSKPSNQFVKYYTTAAAREEVLQQNDLVKFAFLQLSSPSGRVSCSTEHFSREIKTGTKKINDSTTVDVFKTVTATITTYTKSIDASGVMEMQVLDFKTNTIINRETNSQSYTWTDSWQEVSGDSEALNGKTCSKSMSYVEPSNSYFFNQISQQFASHFRGRLKKTYRNM